MQICPRTSALAICSRPRRPPNTSMRSRAASSTRQHPLHNSSNNSRTRPRPETAPPASTTRRRPIRSHSARSPWQAPRSSQLYDTQPSQRVPHILTRLRNPSIPPFHMLLPRRRCRSRNMRRRLWAISLHVPSIIAHTRALDRRAHTMAVRSSRWFQAAEGTSMLRLRRACARTVSRWEVEGEVGLTGSRSAWTGSL
jgi:hypothetical protein